MEEKLIEAISDLNNYEELTEILYTLRKIAQTLEKMVSVMSGDEKRGVNHDSI